MNFGAWIRLSGCPADERHELPRPLASLRTRLRQGSDKDSTVTRVNAGQRRETQSVPLPKDLQVGWLEGVVVGLLGRAGRDAHHEIHLRPQVHEVARLGEGRADGDLPERGNFYVHEHVEGRRDVVCSYPEGVEALGQILQAARVVALVALVEHLEGLRAAGREEKVVPADLVFDDGEHWVAAVGVEHVAGGLVYGVVVVDRAARRQ